MPHTATIDRLVALGAGRIEPSDLPDGLDPATVQILPGASNDVTVIVVSGESTPRAAGAALKLLAGVAGAEHRSIAVLGELETDPADWRDEHDAIGRLVVRLNISYLLVIGDRARHIHNAAGLEGSWDGESQLLPDAARGYDLLRDDLRAGDIVLVKSTAACPLDGLAERLARGDAA